jgi:stress-induced-phosphoprotein 1
VDALDYVSAAYLGWHKYAEAAEDAAKCLAIKPDFVKAYHRHGLALKGLEKYDEALATLRAGQRVDFNNKDLNKLITEIEPLQQKVEQARRSGMSRAEQLKEEGNDAFKTAAFERAIELYTQALEACESQASAVAIACYNNRAACNQQLSNFSAVIRDCSHVLEHDAESQKALLRRALAYEGLERYRLALQDIRSLLAINPNIEVRTASVGEKKEEDSLWADAHGSLAGVDREQGPAPSRRIRAQAERRQLERERGVFSLVVIDPLSSIEQRD